MEGFVIYDNVAECFPVLKNEYLSKINEIPQVKIFCLESYISKMESRENYLQKISKIFNTLRNKLSNKQKKMYLCAASVKKAESNAIKDCYKLWKLLKLKYDISNFKLGNEYKLQLNGSDLFAGCAEIDYTDLDRAIEIVTSTPLLTEKCTKYLFEEIGIQRIKKIRHDIFDFAYLYHLMDKGDIIINFAEDGEKISMFLAEKRD